MFFSGAPSRPSSSFEIPEAMRIEKEKEDALSPEEKSDRMQQAAAANAASLRHQSKLRIYEAVGAIESKSRFLHMLSLRLREIAEKYGADSFGTEQELGDLDNLLIECWESRDMRRIELLINQIESRGASHSSASRLPLESVDPEIFAWM